MSIKRAVSVGILALNFLAQVSADPRGASNVSASADPFPDEIAAARQADMVWHSAENRLIEIGTRCVAGGDQLIDQARNAMTASVGAYQKYYEHTAVYWAKYRDASGNAATTGRAEGAELQAHLNQLQAELQSVRRRKQDLERLMVAQRMHSREDQSALQDLERIETKTLKFIDQARATIEQNNTVHAWTMDAKDYAQKRWTETNELLLGTRSQLYFYRQLYNAIGYRYTLICHKEIPPPAETDVNWRDSLKNLAPRPPQR